MKVRFEDLTVGAEIPARDLLVTREQVFAYAEASGDHNPLHQDEAVAKEAGFPGIVAHGMFTMGHLASCLADWLGDPNAIVRMRAQFRAPVFLGDTIVAGGSVRALDPVQRRAVLDVWVRVERDGTVEWPIRKSQAEVVLP